MWLHTSPLRVHSPHLPETRMLPRNKQYCKSLPDSFPLYNPIALEIWWHLHRAGKFWLRMPTTHAVEEMSATKDDSYCDVYFRVWFWDIWMWYRWLPQSGRFVCISPGKNDGCTRTGAWIQIFQKRGKMTLRTIWYQKAHTYKPTEIFPSVQTLVIMYMEIFKNARVC